MAAESAAPSPAAENEKSEERETAKASRKAAKSAAQSASQDDKGAAPNVTLAAHPRAARSVARAKALAGLIGFVLGGYLSLPTHTLPAAAVRALLSGIFCYVVVWGAAVFLWRRIVVAELRHAQHQLLAAELSRLGIADSTERVR